MQPEEEEGLNTALEPTAVSLCSTAAVPQVQATEMLGLFRGARAHDYEWLLQVYAEKGGARLPPSVVPHFARVNSWSTDMRYAPGTIAAREAQAFVDSAAEILLWADGRL